MCLPHHWGLVCVDESQGWLTGEGTEVRSSQQLEPGKGAGCLSAW